MQLKKERGYVFRDLEGRGWLNDWQDEDEEDEQDMKDYTLQDIDMLEKKGKGKGKTRESTEENSRHSNEYFDRNRVLESASHEKMQSQLTNYS